MHRSHLRRFMADIVTPLNGIALNSRPSSGSQLQECFLRTSCPCHGRSDRSLEDLVEIDPPSRSEQETRPRVEGRGPQGKCALPARSAIARGRAGRGWRGFSARMAFVAGTSAPGARVITDAEAIAACPDHQPKVVGSTRPCADGIASCVLEPEALGARNLPWPAPAHLRVPRRASCSAGRRHTATAFGSIGTSTRRATSSDNA